MRRLAATLAFLVVLVAACGEDGNRASISTTSTATSSVSTSTPAAPEPPASAEIRETVREWSPLFARDDFQFCAKSALALADACTGTNSYGIDDQVFGKGNPTAFQRSFAGAAVAKLEVRGDRATAELTNGERIELADEGGWKVSNLLAR